MKVGTTQDVLQCELMYRPLKVRVVRLG